jgi:hypothetical protein
VEGTTKGGGSMTYEEDIVACDHLYPNSKMIVTWEKYIILGLILLSLVLMVVVG